MLKTERLLIFQFLKLSVTIPVPYLDKTVIIAHSISQIIHLWQRGVKEVLPLCLVARVLDIKSCDMEVDLTTNFLIKSLHCNFSQFRQLNNVSDKKITEFSKIERFELCCCALTCNQTLRILSGDTVKRVLLERICKSQGNDTLRLQICKTITSINLGF